MCAVVAELGITSSRAVVNSNMQSFDHPLPQTHYINNMYILSIILSLTSEYHSINLPPTIDFTYLSPRLCNGRPQLVRVHKWQAFTRCIQLSADIQQVADHSLAGRLGLPCCFRQLSSQRQLSKTSQNMGSWTEKLKQFIRALKIRFQIEHSSQYRLYQWQT